MALTRPDAIPDRRRLRETIPDTTVCSTAPPHSLHVALMLVFYPAYTGRGYT